MRKAVYKAGALVAKKRRTHAAWSLQMFDNDRGGLYREGTRHGCPTFALKIGVANGTE
jgi:hypothetical protein